MEIHAQLSNGEWHRLDTSGWTDKRDFMFLWRMSEEDDLIATTDSETYVHKNNIAAIRIEE